MTWKNERDLLIAQTAAFVQSVAGKTADAERPPLGAQLPPVWGPHPSTADQRPADVLPTRLTPISHGDLRDEIRQRVDAFRAQQQAFDRERREYCNAMMAKLRAEREEAIKARDNPTLKR